MTNTAASEQTANDNQVELGGEKNERGFTFNPRNRQRFVKADCPETPAKTAARRQGNHLSGVARRGKISRPFRARLVLRDSLD